MPACMSLLLIGNVLENAVLHLSLNVTQRWLLCGSLSILLTMFVCMQLLHKGTGKGNRNIRKPYRLLVRVVATVFLMLLPMIREELLRPWQLLTVVNGIMIILIIFDSYGRRMTFNVLMGDEPRGTEAINEATTEIADLEGTF